jgi:hypothetical protein
MADETVQVVPVSVQRVEDCHESARFWVRELPLYADRNQRLADGWALAAGVLSAVTGLAIFPVLTDTSTDLQKALVAAGALLASVFALVPRIMNYGELAGAARELTSRYGSVLGDLLDLTLAEPFPAEAALVTVTEFEETKAKKDGLRGLPDRTTVQLRRLEAEARLAEAEAQTEAAKRKAAAARHQP